MDTNRFENFYPDAGKENLLFLFFVVFSRFEYSLKKAGFLEKTQEAKPDWNTFAKDLESEFRSKIKESSNETPLKSSVTYFAENPPKKQIVKVNQDERVLAWGKEDKKDPAIISLEQCLIYIRRVRNNLFHGGKYPFLQRRDEELLEHSLCLLEECLGFESNSAKAVEKYFFDLKN